MISNLPKVVKYRVPLYCLLRFPMVYISEPFEHNISVSDQFPVVPA